MLLSHVCGTWSICCLTCNAMPHVRFTLSVSCLPLCCGPMFMALGPFAAILVMPYPMSVSLCSSADCCYVAVSPVCGGSVALGPFAVLLVMPCLRHVWLRATPPPTPSLRLALTPTLTQTLNLTWGGEGRYMARNPARESYETFRNIARNVAVFCLF